MTDARQAIENEIMKDDIELDLKLKDVKITGECIVTEENIIFYKTVVTGEDDEVTHLWVAAINGEVLIEDEQPEGIHIPAKVV